MSSFIMVPLTEMVDIHDYLRKPVSQTERNKREGLYPYFGATGQIGWIDKYRQDGKYVILGEDGAPFLDPQKPKAYIVEGKCWVNNHAHVLKGIDRICDDDFLCFALNWADYSDAVTGSTRLKLPQNMMNRLLIPKPPIEKQRQIAVQLKAQLAEVETARKAAETQSAEIANIIELAIENEISVSLANGEHEVFLGDIVDLTAKLVDPTTPEMCILPHVSAENIASVTGEFLGLKSAAEDGMKSNKYMFESGDVLYSKLRPYLRKVALPDFAGLCSADMYPLKANPEFIDSRFLKILYQNSSLKIMLPA